MDDIDEARDWRGDEIDCAACSHQDLTNTERCRLKHACVHDRYARRIDRFFDWNPELANSYLAHPHFEVRAIAAKHAGIFLLPPLLDDPEETVRWNAARRLPKRLMLQAAHRSCIARSGSASCRLLDDAELMPMMADPDYYVRLVIARRVAPTLLSRMINDEEAEVRRIVARRIPRDWLLTMAGDPDSGVRLEVAQRLAPDLLSRLRDDPDWRVRYEVASRIASGRLGELADDSDDLVQEMARSRATGGGNG